MLDWFFLYLLSFTICICWITPAWTGLLVFIGTMIIFQIYIRYRTNQYKNSPKYTAQQLYHELQHGDIVFSYEYDSHHITNNILLKYFNYHLSHGSLIIEENGEKYLVESNPGETGDLPHTITSVIQTGIGPWNITKTPLMEYITVYGTYVYQVFRNHQPVPFVYSEENHPTPSPSSIYYCTMFVGDTLHSHGIIPASSRLLRYRPTELIQMLKDVGYQSFYLVKY